VLQKKRKEKKRKEVNQSKIGEEQKRKKIIRKVSLDQTMSEQMCRIVKSKKKGKVTVTITWVKP